MISEKELTSALLLAESVLVIRSAAPSPSERAMGVGLVLGERLQWSPSLFLSSLPLTEKWLNSVALCASDFCCITNHPREFPCSPVARTLCFLCWVQSLLRDLRSRKLLITTTKNKHNNNNKTKNGSNHSKVSSSRN